MRLRRFRHVLFCLFSICMLSACVNTKKAIYFNGINDTIIINKIVETAPIIQKSDLLNITVTSLNPEASAIFNLSNNMPMPSASLNTAAGLPSTSIPGATQVNQVLG